MSCYRHAWPMLVGICAMVVSAAQQAVAPQEVRVSSRTYVPPPPYTLRAQTTLVEVGVVARDQHGRAIAGLTQSDFKIYDQGRERPIAAFSVDTYTPAEMPRSAAQNGNATSQGTIAPPPARAVHAPRYIALVFDDVHTSDGDLSDTRLAAERFVKEALQPDDRVGIFTTWADQTLDFTAEVSKLVASIEKLRAHPRMSENGLLPCPRITPYQAYLIVNMDPVAMRAAIAESGQCFGAPAGSSAGVEAQLRPLDREVQALAQQTWEQARIVSQGTLDVIKRAVDHLAQMPGNRVLLLASAGFLAETLEYEQNRIIDHALRGGVVVNALDAKGLFAAAKVRSPDQVKNLTSMPISTMMFEASTRSSQLQTLIAPIAYLAQSTGGLFFHDSNDLVLGFKELGAVPEVTYRLGFRPGEVPDERYHKLKVKLMTPTSYLVQARPGYFASAKQSPPPITPQQKLDQELMAADTLAAFPVGVTVEPGNATTGEPLIW